MVKKAFLFVLVVCSVLANFCYANPLSEDSLKEKINHILESKHHCVNKFDDTKIYIHAENLIPTEEGLLIDLNGYETVIAPPVYSDSAGCFIKIPSSQWIEIIPRCSSCGKAVLNGTCNNPNCDRYGR